MVTVEIVPVENGSLLCMESTCLFRSMCANHILGEGIRDVLGPKPKLTILTWTAAVCLSYAGLAEDGIEQHEGLGDSTGAVRWVRENGWIRNEDENA